MLKTMSVEEQLDDQESKIFEYEYHLRALETRLTSPEIDISSRREMQAELSEARRELARLRKSVQRMKHHNEKKVVIIGVMVILFFLIYGLLTYKTIWP